MKEKFTAGPTRKKKKPFGPASDFSFNLFSGGPTIIIMFVTNRQVLVKEVLAPDSQTLFNEC